MPPVCYCVSTTLYKPREKSATADRYTLGLLLHTVFNLTHPLPPTAQPPHLPPQVSSRGAIPSSVFSSFKTLLDPNPYECHPRSYWTLVWQSWMEKDMIFFMNRSSLLCFRVLKRRLASSLTKCSAYSIGCQTLSPLYSSSRTYGLYDNHVLCTWNRPELPLSQVTSITRGRRHHSVSRLRHWLHDPCIRSCARGRQLVGSTRRA